MTTLQAIRRARQNTCKIVKKTPLIQSQFLSSYCQGDVYLKLENQQLTNSFKIRGALNCMSQLDSKDRKRQLLEIPAKIVVPTCISKAKLAKIKKYEVELIFQGDFDEVEQYAREITLKEGLTYISPYNDDRIIAGQGTVGLEILEDLKCIDTVVIPLGGGGLISGIAIAIKAIKPTIQIIGVQSEVAAVMIESVKAGKILEGEEGESLAEGLLGGLEKGAITFDLVKKHVDELFLVKEETIKEAIYHLWENEHQVVEGAGAITIAAIIENKNHFKDKTTVAVISGGNIEKSLFQEIIKEMSKT
ncbi:MAG: threonine ammonia-lyase [Candidatus Hodarchaeales archaeon]